MTWWKGNKWNNLVLGFVNIFEITRWQAHKLPAQSVVYKGTVKQKCLATSHTTVVCAFRMECTETCLLLCYDNTDTSQTAGCYYLSTELAQMQEYWSCAVPCLTLQCLELCCCCCCCCCNMTSHSWRLKLNTLCYQKLGSVSSPLCVWKLERVRSQTQLCQLRCFNDYTRQLHVSVFTGHLQAVFKWT